MSERSAAQSRTVASVVGEGGRLVVANAAGQEGEGFVAAIVAVDGGIVRKERARTITDVLTRIGAGVTSGKPHLVPDQGGDW